MKGHRQGALFSVRDALFAFGCSQPFFEFGERQIFPLRLFRFLLASVGQDPEGPLAPAPVGTAKGIRRCLR